MDYWAKPGLDRNQAMLFYPTLDECVDDNHPVRHLDEILRGLDWSAWTVQYNGHVGQPPIPPWVLAGVILYGMMRRIRSSRQLEYACGNNVDFMWLAERRHIDHSTICEFRTKFREPLKDLFKQVGRLAMSMGLVKLLEVAFDGTRVKANASRFHTWTAPKIEAALKELETQIEQCFKDAEEADASQEPNLGSGSTLALPPELDSMRKRREKLQEHLAKLQQADEDRKKDGLDPKKNPAQMPKADPSSKVMPNKEGGYAPNYTPLAANDGTRGIILDCDVIGGPHEQNELLPSMDRIQETFGQMPEKAAADKAFGTGANLEGMQSRGIDFHTPMEAVSPEEGNPAKRDDPRQAVPQQDWPKLPRNDKKRLDKCCFAYDEAADLYYCPMGRPMPYEQTKKEERSSGTVEMRVYRCAHCQSCPLAAECLDPRGKHGRSIRRDTAEPLRQAMRAKMQTAEAKKTYNRRMHIGETPFAILKNVLSVRQFLLRGLVKVQAEWRWVCTAFNLKKLIAVLVALRAEVSEKGVGLGG